MTQDEVTRLIRLLDETAAVLRARGLDHWAAWLEGDNMLIPRGDAYGLDHLLSAYGGMGSINDLPDEDICARLSQIYDIAMRVGREHE